MIILSIETSTSEYDVGVTVGSSDVFSTTNRFRPDYDGIAGLVERCLVEAGVRVSQLDAIAVDQGPGNLTSVRAGLAYANALAFATGLPLYTGTSLQIMAHAADRANDQKAPVFVARAARGRESGPFYAAVYENDKLKLTTLDLLTNLCDSLAVTYSRLKLAGTHIEAQAKSLHGVSTIDTGITRPSAGPLSTLTRKGLLQMTTQALPLTEDSEAFRV